MSIKPKWVELILKLHKRAEVRTSRPRLPTPFRIFIYQTGNGGVVGEFTCDFIESAIGKEINLEFLEQTFVSVAEAQEYAMGKPLYKWYIRSLIIYTEPKPLSEYGLERPPQSWCYL